MHSERTPSVSPSYVLFISQWAPAFFPGGTRPGLGINLPPGYSTEVKERVELCGPSYPILVLTLSLSYFKVCGTFHLHRETRRG